MEIIMAKHKRGNRKRRKATMTAHTHTHTLILCQMKRIVDETLRAYAEPIDNDPIPPVLPCASCEHCKRQVNINETREW